MTKKFILVSLNEKKAKKIAEVISNNTCRKILDFLSGRKDATASQIHKELKIPLPTVDYNLKSLMVAKLIKSDEYHYSEKGKEVSHYKIANQYVIIAPAEETASIREKLKSILPVAAIAGLSASMIKLFSGWFSYPFSVSKMAVAPLMAKAGGARVADSIVESVESEVMYESAPRVVSEAANTLGDVASQSVPRAAPILADDAMVEATNTIADESVKFATDQTQELATEHLAQEVVTDSFMATEPIIKRSFSDYLLSNIPQLIIFFIVGAALGVGGYYLYKHFKKKRDRVEIKV